MVQHFYQTAPTKRKFALEINEEPVIKRRRKQAEEERDSDSSSPNNQVPVKKKSSTEDSSDETDSEKDKLKSDVEENALVADYLQKVTPGIAREFQV